MAIKYQRGTIILISQVHDKNNVNPKNRFVVVVRDFDDTDTLLFGVAITGTFTRPLPITSVSLPYHSQGRCKTGLTKPCVADCTWIVMATGTEIIKKNGFAPPIELLAIIQEVQNHLPPLPAPPLPKQPPTTAGS